MRPKIYLAGAIRDGIDEDIIWRERVIDALCPEKGRKLADIFNPLGGKTYSRGEKMWDLAGVMPVASVIVPHDFYHVDNSDIVLFNFRALSEKYPNIGTLVEFGRATKSRCLIYSIVDSAYRGHDSAGIFSDKLHPFIKQNSAIVFADVDMAIAFLLRYLPVLSGDSPRFGGVTD